MDIVKEIIKIIILQVYYVCNTVGDDWIQLPDVTPQQIVASRQIVKYFTGNLEQEVSNTCTERPTL